MVENDGITLLFLTNVIVMVKKS